MHEYSTPPEADEPKFVKFIKNNLFFILVSVGIVSFYFISKDTLEKYETERQTDIRSKKENIRNFAKEKLGGFQIMDSWHNWDTSYGARVSVDVTKPMVYIECRPSDDFCWVVQEVK